MRARSTHQSQSFWCSNFSRRSLLCHKVGCAHSGMKASCTVKGSVTPYRRTWLDISTASHSLPLIPVHPSPPSFPQKAHSMQPQSSLHSSMKRQGTSSFSTRVASAGRSHSRKALRQHSASPKASAMSLSTPKLPSKGSAPAVAPISARSSRRAGSSRQMSPSEPVPEAHMARLPARPCHRCQSTRPPDSCAFAARLLSAVLLRERRYCSTIASTASTTQSIAALCSSGDSGSKFGVRPQLQAGICSSKN
mmetsp:Transcript_68729/g.201225  ORF Transcript_68729/g.201225 Transcript_68729/m.201225 type:complete len:250 (+) Transcript_68729:1159-1908(+)